MAVVLVACADDRQVGRIGDARQVVQTAVAIATTGEVGVARGIQLSAIPRPGGDAVARYGLGMSLAQLPASALAPSFEKAFGPGGSQSLFLLAPLALGLLTAAAAGRAARLLGAGGRGEGFAVLLASLGSPLGYYFTCDLSEPLQAACLVGAFVSALEARRQETRGRGLAWAGLGGLAAGAAVLTKAGLVVVAPFALLPLLGPSRSPQGASRGARIAVAATGALPILSVWAAAEYVRFGGLFRSYGGESFSYPFLEGLLRLVLSPNKGLLLFFPALVPALVEAARRWRAGARSAPGEAGSDRLEVLASLLPLASLLAMAAPWWAWHGVAGWGPRLLVPGLPAVAALAACAAERWKPSRGRTFVAASILLDALPLIQSSAPVATYVTKLAPVPVPAEVARRFPPFGGPASSGTEPQVPGVFVLNEVPLASDHITHAWLLWVRSGKDARERARRLEYPPWRSSRPDLVSTIVPFSPRFVAAVAPPPSLGFLGRSVVGGPDPASGKAYSQALSNQVLRALQQRKLDRALDLAGRLHGINPSADSAALVTETYRLLGRRETMMAFVDSLSPKVRATPPIFAVLALAARDAGNEASARAWMERAAALGTPAVTAALGQAPSAWPADYADFLADERNSTIAALPGFGEAGSPVTTRPAGSGER